MVLKSKLSFSVLNIVCTQVLCDRLERGCEAQSQYCYPNPNSKPIKKKFLL